MPDALLAQFCRASKLDPSFVVRCQREFRQRIQPQLDRLDALNEENLTLQEEVSSLRVELAELKKKRGPGRPKKVAPPEAEVSA